MSVNVRTVTHVLQIKAIWSIKLLSLTLEEEKFL